MVDIVIVDDHPDIIDAMQRIVDSLGYSHTSASDGEELLKVLDKTKPKLILLDVMMPGMTTKDILQEVHQRDKNIKIMLATVVRFSDKELAALKKQFNIVEYVTKPFDVFNLGKLIKKHVGKSS